MALFQTDHLWLSQLDKSVVALYLDVQNRPVNVLSQQVLSELEQALDFVTKEKALQRLLICSGKKGNFIAGADINEFADIKTSEQATALSQRGQQLFNKLSGLTIPTIAVINGPCLGGGLELALACKHRCVVDDPKVQLGFPEVELGLLPAWGGTQRLPRRVGLERALQIMLLGKRLRAKDALTWGLVDMLLPPGEPDLSEIQDAALPVSSATSWVWRWRNRLLGGTGFGRKIVFRVTRNYMKARVPDDMPAPWEVLNAVETGLRDGLVAGLKYEREAASRLAVSPACRNLVGIFVKREQARKQPDDASALKRIGIVGAGTMGAGIAQLAALRGYEVIVQEMDEGALGIGMFRIVGLFEQAAKRGIISRDELTTTMANVHGSISWKRFDEVDLVIEAIVEDVDVKRKLFQEIENHVAAETVIATNTSSLRVADLQKGLDHPERVAGLHFFNPVHKMPLVEIVHAPNTDKTVIDKLLPFVIRLGKTPVVVKDSSGFLVNRILMPYLNEAVQLVGEGLPIAAVDKIMKRFGMPMGPLEVLDQIGLDVAAHVAAAMQGVFGERLTPHPGFALLHEKGWLGQKADKGFYLWDDHKKKANTLAENSLQMQAKEHGVTPLTADDIKAVARERMVGLMVNEAALCLGEELVADADTLNLAMVFGTGWAPHRGGPLQYAEDRGYRDIVVAMQKLQERFGPRFAPCDELVRRAT